jgi:pre-mRNA-processing factor 39
MYGVTSQNSAQALDGVAQSDDTDKSGQPEDLSSTDVENLAKYISIREEMYKKAKEYESKIIGFEIAIRRPYFHVEPLDNPELENWHNYLDFIEKEEEISKVCFSLLVKFCLFNLLDFMEHLESYNLQSGLIGSIICFNG